MLFLQFAQEQNELLKSFKLSFPEKEMLRNQLIVELKSWQLHLQLTPSLQFQATVCLVSRKS